MCSFPPQQTCLQLHVWPAVLRRQPGRLAEHPARWASSAGRRRSHSHTAWCWCWAPALPWTVLAASQNPRDEHSLGHYGRKHLEGTMCLNSCPRSGWDSIWTVMPMACFLYEHKLLLSWWWSLIASEMKTYHNLNWETQQANRFSLWICCTSKLYHHHRICSEYKLSFFFFPSSW